MKLKMLKTLIDEAVAYAGDCDPDVEVWVGEKRAYRIGRIGQFGVVPDVTITVGEKVYDSEEIIRGKQK